jgi:hypothetical protein
MRPDDSNELSQLLGSSEECLPFDQLVTAIEGKRGSEEQASAKKHLAACPYCEAELALFREFESPEIRPQERADVQAIVASLRKNSPVPVTAPWWKSVWNFKILVPASLVAVALLAIAVFIPRPHEPQLASFSSDDTLRSQRLEALSPIGTVQAVPDVLVWSPVKGAVNYRVRLFEVDNTQLWEAEVQTTSVRLPDRILKQAIPLKKLHWQVTAFEQAGNAIADSGTQSFTLQQPAAP